MKPWTNWLARLGIAGACVMAVGCGGGDVADPSADGEVATESAPPPPESGEAPLPPVAPPTQGRRLAGRGAPKAAEEAPAEETPAPTPEAEKPAPPKTEGGSATAEMLAVATNAGGGANPQPNAGAPPAAPQSGSAGAMAGMRQQMMQSQGGGPRMGPGGSGSANPGGSAGGVAPPMRPGSAVGGGGSPNPSDMAAQMQRQMQGQRNQGGQGGPGGSGGPAMAGRSGGPGGPGGSPANDKPADFSRPYGAVEAFLNALKDKDADRLLEASALRASLEPPVKNQNLFKKIFDLSLSDSEFDELASKLEGYRIAFENPPKSTGKIEVVLQKMSDDGSGHTLVITVRKEKKGWGVLKIDKPTEFKPLGQTPRRSTGTGGNR